MSPGKAIQRIRSQRKKHPLSKGFVPLFWAFLGFFPLISAGAPLQVVLPSASGERVLLEKGGSGGRSLVLSELLDQAMESLGAEGRSQVDLVILQGVAEGKQAWIPRAFITKVQMKLVPDRKAGAPGSGFRAVVPPEGRSRSLKEGLPWETYEVSGVRRIELTSYQERLGSQFLKRRTDPAALRGEKLFVQNCLACHASVVPQWKGRGADFSAVLPGKLSQHPKIQGVRDLDERSARALVSYWNAWVAEHASNR